MFPLASRWGDVPTATTKTTTCCSSRNNRTIVWESSAADDQWQFIGYRLICATSCHSLFYGLSHVWHLSTTTLETEEKPATWSYGALCLHLDDLCVCLRVYYVINLNCWVGAGVQLRVMWQYRKNLPCTFFFFKVGTNWPCLASTRSIDFPLAVQFAYFDIVATALGFTAGAVQAKIRSTKKTRGPEIRSMKSFSTVMCDIFSVHTDGVLYIPSKKHDFYSSLLVFHHHHRSNRQRWESLPMAESA